MTMNFINDNEMIYENDFGKFYIEIASGHSDSGTTIIHKSDLEQMYIGGSVGLNCHLHYETALYVNGVVACKTNLRLIDVVKYNHSIYFHTAFHGKLIEEVQNNYREAYPEEFI